MNSQPNCSTPRQAFVEIRRMWEGGPLREVYVGPPLSKRQRAPGQFLLNAKGLCVGRYVCDRCQEGCNGVYHLTTPSTNILWLCAPCKEAIRPKQKQPAQLRRAPLAKAMFA